MTKNLLFCITILSVTVLVPAVASGAEGPPTIGLIGDSTVATKYGWGPEFADELEGKAQVIHYVRKGATLDSLSDSLDGDCKGDHSGRWSS